MEHGSTVLVREPGEISIRELLADTWRAKWMVLAIVLIFTLAGAGAGLLITKKYRAEILISPRLGDAANHLARSGRRRQAG